MTLKAARIAELERAQSAIARKVLDAVPIVQWWSVAQIITEAGRQGRHVEHRVALGCLNALQEAGLVRHVDGQYQRVVGREPATKRVELAPVPVHAPPVAAVAVLEKDDPLDELSALGDELRSVLAALAKAGAQLEQLAARADAVAVRVDDSIKAARADAQSLRQLRTLLKNIGGGE